MRVRRFLHLVLLLLAGTLGWQVVATWTTALPEVNPPPVLPGQLNGGKETPLRFPSLDEVQHLAVVIADKNLFSPDRRRPEEEAVASVSIPPPDHLKLVGVILLPGEELLRISKRLKKRRRVTCRRCRLDKFERIEEDIVKLLHRELKRCKTLRSSTKQTHILLAGLLLRAIEEHDHGYFEEARS